MINVTYVLDIETTCFVCARKAVEFGLCQDHFIAWMNAPEYSRNKIGDAAGRTAFADFVAREKGEGERAFWELSNASEALSLP